MQSNSTPVRSSTDSSNHPRANMAAAAFMMSFNNNCRMTVYRCAYCTRTFHSSQALGGHQNAHRRDRIVAREKFVQERLAFMTKQVNSLTPPNFPLVSFPHPQPNPNFEHQQITLPPPVARSGPTYFDPAARIFQPGGVLATGQSSTSPLVGFQQTGLLGYGPPHQNELGFEMCFNPGPPSSRAGFNNFPNDQQACLGTYDYINPYYLNNNNNNNNIIAYPRSTTTTTHEIMNSAKKMKMSMAIPNWETGMEASSNTAESHTNDPKAANGGGGGDQDRKNEVTSSKKRTFIDLTYSP